jgi:hypothetical protein
MCVARKSGPGREYSVAVDWRDCAWSPRIVVRLRLGKAAGPAMRDEGARAARNGKPVTKRLPASNLFF